MINMIENARNEIRDILAQAYETAAAVGQLPAGAMLEGTVEIPKDTSNGDYAATHAMSGARALRMAPRKIAEVLAANANLEGSSFSSIEVAGPGFLNFRLADKWYAGVLNAVCSEGENYGTVDVYTGKKMMVEFVSANPTGPMHMGNARGGVLGDSLASVLERAGYTVEREFYVNDAGNQIEKFASSIDARYTQILAGKEDLPDFPAEEKDREEGVEYYDFPADGYHGDDIRELAASFREQFGDRWLEKSVEERHAAMAKFGLERNIPKMQADLGRYGIQYDTWFFESSLHDSGFVADSVGKLTERGYTYEKDGALWLKTSQILADKARAEGKSEEEIEKLELKDDVLRRANGFFTYFAADIAYHRNKFETRGFDKVINVWGADHHGHVARLKGAMDALGLDGEHRLDIVLMQLVKLQENGVEVRMSKRTGKMISLSNLLDDIPVDAARYFFNSRPESPVVFDLELAKRQDSENPVYYVQYAHARICSVLRNLREDGYEVPALENVSVANLSTETERELMKQLALLPEEVRLAARDYDPSRINKYVTDLASAFHKFYTVCRIKDAGEGIVEARLLLADCVRRVIAISLGIIGVSAPERM